MLDDMLVNTYRRGAHVKVSRTLSGRGISKRAAGNDLRDGQSTLSSL